MSKKPVKTKPAPKRPAPPMSRTPKKPVPPVKAGKASSAPTQFEFGKLLDVVERQAAKAPVRELKPDAATRAAIEAIVRRENELIRKAMRKQGRTAAWVRQQWKALGHDEPSPSDDCTPEEYADRVRRTDRAVPPPGPVRARLLEAGRKLKG
jgi:outer membrane biosynthesis protein TonB